MYFEEISQYTCFTSFFCAHCLSQEGDDTELREYFGLTISLHGVGREIPNVPIFHFIIAITLIPGMFFFFIS